jgi:carbamoyltransferase
MKVLGFGGPFFLHDPAAAVVVDGRVIAAAEEERFVRKKHAVGLPSIEAIKYCMAEADLRPDDIDAVAFPWSFKAFNRKKWEYAARTILSEPSRAYKVLTKGARSNSNIRRSVSAILEGLGFNVPADRIYFVEHHLAHASSAYHLSGYGEAAIMTIDGSGEFTSTLFAKGTGGEIKKIKEIDLPDSLGRSASINLWGWRLMGIRRSAIFPGLSSSMTIRSE